MTHLPGCTGKVAFPTRALAKQSQRLNRTHGRRLHVYRCTWADHWHLTSHATCRADIRDRRADLRKVVSA